MSTALEQAKQTIEAVKQGKVLEPEMALRKAAALAQVAQAEAEERQAAALERANEIALMALDPWAALKAKDDEIARLVDIIRMVRMDSGWGFLTTPTTKVVLNMALASPEQRAEDERRLADNPDNYELRKEIGLRAFVE